MMFQHGFLHAIFNLNYKDIFNEFIAENCICSFNGCELDYVKNRFFEVYSTCSLWNQTCKSTWLHLRSKNQFCFECENFYFTELSWPPTIAKIVHYLNILYWCPVLRMTTVYLVWLDNSSQFFKKTCWFSCWCWAIIFITRSFYGLFSLYQMTYFIACKNNFLFQHVYFIVQARYG